MRTYTKQKQACMIIADFAPVLFHFIFVKFPAVLQKAGWPWEWIIQKGMVSILQMLRYLSKQALKIVIRFQVVRFRGLLQQMAGIGCIL